MINRWLSSYTYGPGTELMTETEQPTKPAFPLAPGADSLVRDIDIEQKYSVRILWEEKNRNRQY